MKRLLSMLLAVILIISSSAFAFQANADELRTVKISGVYHQTQARALLKKVNEFRTNRLQAWAWNENNSQKIYYTRNPYSYDYQLETIAMQRAAEIAVYYAGDHTRPNGSSWRTAHTQYNESTGYAIGENIFAVTNCGVEEGANTSFNEWLETNEPYRYQSHRRNLLSAEYDFTTMALACFEVNEVYYWVALFRSKNLGTAQTTVNTNTVTKSVSFNAKFVKNFEFSYPSLTMSLECKNTQTVLLEGKLITTNHILSYIESATGQQKYIPTVLQVTPTLTSGNTNILTTSGNTIVAKNAGSTTLTVSAFGATTTYKVNVTRADLSNAVITLKQPLDTFVYTGQMIKPAIQSVTLGSTTLTTNDYDITYGENTEIGDGVIAISGKGNYEGAVSKAFSIIAAEDCPHYEVTDNAVAPTCIANGKTQGSHCAICGEVFAAQRVVPASENYHKIVNEPAVEPTCTTNGFSATSYCSVCYEVFAPKKVIPALGHDYPGTYTINKATLTKNGLKYQRCTICNALKSDYVIIYYPKTFTLSKTAFVYTGKAQKPTLVIKNAAGKVIPAANYTATIPTGKNVGRYLITIKFKGAYYTGTKNLYFDILPKNTPKFTASGAKKAIKTAWTTQKVQTNGYQIQYSLYSNFKTVKTFTLKNPKYASATISGLTGGKRYYVRIRTYRTVTFNGKKMNLFSTWSAAKAVTTKK